MKKLAFIFALLLLFGGLSRASRDFDEINDKIEIADDAAFTLPDSDWAISIWVKLTDNAGSFFQYFISWGVVSSPNSFQMFFAEASASDANKVRIITEDLSGSQIAIISSTTPGTSTAWQHFLVQRTGEATITIYNDGTDIGSSFQASYNAVNSDTNIFLGSRDDEDADRFYGGRLAEFVIWRRALSANERAAIVACAPPTKIAGARFVHLPLWGTASPEADLSGNGNNGTVTGAVKADHICGPFR